jgi:hypothetical protein
MCDGYGRIYYAPRGRMVLTAARCMGALVLACMAACVTSCERTPEIPANAEILGETTVATVNGCRVGSGNFFETADPSGRRRMSIMVAIWRPGAPEGRGAVNTTVFEGDTFDICGKAYRLFLVAKDRKGENGTAYIVPREK